MAVTNIAGNAEEGSQIIVNKQQISEHHRCEVKIDIADAKYDIIANYEYIRGSGSIPIIDYNPRNEKLSLRGVGSTSRRLTKTCSIVDMIKTAILLLLADYSAGQTVLTKHVNG